MDICVFCEEQVQNTMEKRSGTQEQVSALDTATILFYNYTTNNYVRTYSFFDRAGAKPCEGWTENSNIRESPA